MAFIQDRTPCATLPLLPLALASSGAGRRVLSCDVRDDEACWCNILGIGTRRAGVGSD
jgi:hypothetical protein